MSDLRLGTATAGPGRKAWGQLKVREGKKSVELPVCVVNGARDGQHIVVIANQHGGEINGVESVRLFCEEVDPGKLAGSVFLVASANPRAAMIQNEFWAEKKDEFAKYSFGPILDSDFDRNKCPYNMNRIWPGRKGGLLVERMVYEIWNQAVMAPHRQASLLLDFHCAAEPSCVFASNAYNVALCAATGIECVINVRSPNQKSISNKACFDHGIAVMTVELGGQYKFVPKSVEDGRRAIFNMLRFWDMLPGPPDWPETTLVLDPWRNHFCKRQDGKDYVQPSYMACKAAAEGLVYPHVPNHASVKKGQIVCHIVDPFSGQIVEKCRAPMTGGIYSIFTATHKPKYACGAGDVLFAVGAARSIRTAEFCTEMGPEPYRRNPWGPE